MDKKRAGKHTGKTEKVQPVNEEKVDSGTDRKADDSPGIDSKDHIIEVEDLSKIYGTFAAVDDVSFFVEKGEIFGFLGANGAGKTTCIRMLCGLSKPSKGKAMVAGFDVYTQTEEIKKNIGYMSQKFSLYEDLTAKENIRFYGGIYGLTNKQINEKTEFMIKKLGIGGSENKLLRALPLGWKQKLAFSVAMIHDPKIVFLDEPTGGVDPITRRQFWEMIYEAASNGVTIFVTTHYMDEAEYCHRISMMVAGKIEALDTPANLKKQFHVDSMYDVFVKLARPDEPPKDSAKKSVEKDAKEDVKETSKGDG